MTEPLGGDMPHDSPRGNTGDEGKKEEDAQLCRRSVTPSTTPIVRVGSFQTINGPSPNTPKWIAESRWRSFVRLTEVRIPQSFDDASQRFSLNLPYFLTQYLVIGIFVALCGALLSGGVAFILAVVVTVLLVVIAIAVTSRLQLTNSARFLIFILICSSLLFSFPFSLPLMPLMDVFSSLLVFQSLQLLVPSFGSLTICVSARSASSFGWEVCFFRYQTFVCLFHSFLHLCL